MKKTFSFPKNFKWGVATAAHQIEGNNIHSDWWHWEQTPGRVKNNERSGLACDHWARVNEDIQLMKNLHIKQYRFSVEWARIETAQGVWNEEALKHYKEELALLRAAGIEPMVTLHHFTLPFWVAELGGFEWHGFAEAFAKYTEVVYEAIGTQVIDWITFNEPMVLFAASYIAGVFPPQKKGSLQSLQVPMVNLLKAHAKAYQILHARAKQASVQARVGVAHHLRIFDPACAYHPLDLLMAKISEDFFNWTIPQALRTGQLQFYVPFLLSMNVSIPDLAGTQDYFGFNYYSRDFVKFSFRPPFFKIKVPATAPKNDLDWEIYPEGLNRLLLEIHDRYPDLSISITENGIADAKDSQRIKFLNDHLWQMAEAMKAGVPVEGYSHWSLLDNFEWNSGFSPRFGLYELDYVTMKRIARPSALVYAKIVVENQLLTGQETRS